MGENSGVVTGSQTGPGGGHPMNHHGIVRIDALQLQGGQQALVNAIREV